MSEDKKSLVNLIPEALDNATKNITDKPTQNMGTTLADIWYLVFGGISHAADKRRLKYSYALQEFENELKEKISKIPEDKRVEPDIQVVAPALEAAKYCVEKQELRHMFSTLISNSLNKELSNKDHPLYINIIKSITTFDAKLLLNFFDNRFDSEIDFRDLEKIVSSMEVLAQLGLISYKANYTYDIVQDEKSNYYINFMYNFDIKKILKTIESDLDEQQKLKQTLIDDIRLTKLGIDFITMCL